MSNYTKSTNFATKDDLSTGSALKRLKGAEIDDEFNALSTAIATKANTNNAALTGIPVAPTASAGTNNTQLATTAYTTSAIAAGATLITAAAVNVLVYPVGAIFTTVTEYTTSAIAALIGVGTWEAFGAGRVLVGFDSSDADFNEVAETGGAKTHTLTEAEMPAHTHYSGWRLGGGDGSAPFYGTSHEGGQINTGSAGSSAAHNNVQPYIVVYFWKRTA